MTGKHPFALLLAVLLGIGLRAGDRSAVANEIRVIGNELQVTRADGSLLTAPDLVGAVISFADAGGGTFPLRIDAVQPDRGRPGGGVLLYRFMRREGVSGQWRAFCPATDDGLAVGFPVSGSWGADGAYRPSAATISLICAQSAVGKCVRLGYRLWGVAADGTPFRFYHQACTRAIRADYCGDGTSYTRDGTAIQIHDRLSLRRAEPSSVAAFEALWGPEGALCLFRPRLARRYTLEDLVAACPRLRGKVGSSCKAEAMRETQGALIRSYGAVPFATGH